MLWTIMKMYPKDELSIIILLVLSTPVKFLFYNHYGRKQEAGKNLVKYLIP